MGGEVRPALARQGLRAGQVPPGSARAAAPHRGVLALAGGLEAHAPHRGGAVRTAVALAHEGLGRVLVDRDRPVVAGPAGRRALVCAGRHHGQREGQRPLEVRARLVRQVRAARLVCAALARRPLLPHALCIALGRKLVRTRRHARRQLAPPTHPPPSVRPHLPPSLPALSLPSPLTPRARSACPQGLGPSELLGLRCLLPAAAARLRARPRGRRRGAPPPPSPPPPRPPLPPPPPSHHHHRRSHSPPPL